MKKSDQRKVKQNQLSTFLRSRKRRRGLLQNFFMNVKYLLEKRTYSGRNKNTNSKVSSTEIKATSIWGAEFNFIGVYKLCQSLKHFNLERDLHPKCIRLWVSPLINWLKAGKVVNPLEFYSIEVPISKFRNLDNFAKVLEVKSCIFHFWQKLGL